ncbi:hypothetical protein GCM10009557_68250 [Virgisporangium ochraceum]
MSTTLVRGQNAPLGGSAPYLVVVTHEPGPEVDLTGFLLTGDARAVNEDGMVFYNQPTLDGYPGVEWRAAAPGRHEVALAPDRWPADLARVRVGLTVASGTFGAVRGLSAHVADASGAVMATLDLGQPDRQNALIVGEVYRHGGGWKVRSVGGGFTDALEGLAKDAGIAVAEDDEPAASATATPPAFAPSRIVAMSFCVPRSCMATLSS